MTAPRCRARPAPSRMPAPCCTRDGGVPAACAATRARGWKLNSSRSRCAWLPCCRIGGPEGCCSPPLSSQLTGESVHPSGWCGSGCCRLPPWRCHAGPSCWYCWLPDHTGVDCPALPTPPQFCQLLMCGAKLPSPKVPFPVLKLCCGLGWPPTLTVYRSCCCCCQGGSGCWICFCWRGPLQPCDCCCCCCQRCGPAAARPCPWMRCCCCWPGDRP